MPADSCTPTVALCPSKEEAPTASKEEAPAAAGDFSSHEPAEVDEKTAQNDKGVVDAWDAEGCRGMRRVLPPVLPLRSAALVAEMLGTLREEVKEIAKTDWLYDSNEPQMALRIKV